MTQSLLENLGIYGAACVVGFIAGMFPPFSIEAFLILVSVKFTPSLDVVTTYCLVAAFGHQVAKTMCYFAGVGALERGKLKRKLDANRERIQRWNKWPRTIMFLGAAFGVPPLYLLTFIAKPIMGMGFWMFTAIVLVGRIGRFMVLAVTPLLW